MSMSWYDELPAGRRAKVDAVIADGRFHSTRGVETARAYAGPDAPEPFIFWLLVADRACLRHYGVSIHDLADHCWRDAYDEGLSPMQALREAIAAEGLDL